MVRRGRSRKNERILHEPSCSCFQSFTCMLLLLQRLAPTVSKVHLGLPRSDYGSIRQRPYTRWHRPKSIRCIWIKIFWRSYTNSRLRGASSPDLVETGLYPNSKHWWCRRIQPSHKTSRRTKEPKCRRGWLGGRCASCHTNAT